MRFQAEHHFAGPPDAVLGLLTDAEFHEQLQLPDLTLLEVLDRGTEGHEAILRLRYQYVGQLDPIARRLLGDRKLTWLQELRLDRSSWAGRLGFQSEADPKRLHGEADVVLEDDNAGARRRLDGELVVALPAFGAMAERRIMPGVLRRLDIEARALDQRLRAG